MSVLKGYPPNPEHYTLLINVQKVFHLSSSPAYYVIRQNRKVQVCLTQIPEGVNLMVGTRYLMVGHVDLKDQKVVTDEKGYFEEWDSSNYSSRKGRSCLPK